MKKTIVFLFIFLIVCKLSLSTNGDEDSLSESIDIEDYFGSGEIVSHKKPKINMNQLYVLTVKSSNISETNIYFKPIDKENSDWNFLKQQDVNALRLDKFVFMDLENKRIILDGVEINTNKYSLLHIKENSNFEKETNNQLGEKTYYHTEVTDSKYESTSSLNKPVGIGMVKPSSKNEYITVCSYPQSTTYHCGEVPVKSPKDIEKGVLTSLDRDTMTYSIMTTHNGSSDNFMAFFKVASSGFPGTQSSFRVEFKIDPVGLVSYKGNTLVAGNDYESGTLQVFSVEQDSHNFKVIIEKPFKLDTVIRSYTNPSFAGLYSEVAQQLLVIDLDTFEFESHNFTLNIPKELVPIDFMLSSVQPKFKFSYAKSSSTKLDPRAALVYVLFAFAITLIIL